MKIKFLCAYNPSTNKFFALEEDFATTNPVHVDHPYWAEKHVPYSFQDPDKYFSDIHPAPYYFENSSRMREWLDGFVMVTISMNIEYEITKEE